MILRQAIQENKIWVVGYYLNKGVKPETYMIHLAIQSHALETFRVLLQAATDLSNTDLEGLLNGAVIHKYKPGLDILLERNIPITHSILRNAVSANNVDILATLLNTAQTQPTFKPRWKETLLGQAAKYGQLDILDYLIDQTDIPLSTGENHVLRAALGMDPKNIEAVVHMFISNPRFDPNLGLEHLLTEMAAGNMYEALRELIENPRTQLTHAMVKRVLAVAKAFKSNPQIIDLLEAKL